MRWQSFHQMCDGNYHVAEGATKIARPFRWRDRWRLDNHVPRGRPKISLATAGTCTSIAFEWPKYRPYYGPACEYLQDLQIPHHDSRETSVAGRHRRDSRRVRHLYG